jgi:DNA polymerase-3 subunit alpha
MIHLHVHDEYSVLDSLGRMNKYTDRAKEYGMTSVAETNHGNLYGSYWFWKTCKAKGLKPLLGCEFYICQDHTAPSKEYCHVTLLAKNMTGWENLVTLNNLAWTKGFYIKPRIDRGLLKQYSKGLICMSACLGGEIPREILGNKSTKSSIDFYTDLFKDDFYLELMPLELEEQKLVNLALSQVKGVKKVLTSDCHYTDKKDRYYHKMLLMVQTGQTINDKREKRYDFEAGWFGSPQEMKEEFIRVNPKISESLVDEMIKTTHEVADKIEPIEFDLSLKMPSYEEVVDENK